MIVLVGAVGLDAGAYEDAQRLVLLGNAGKQTREKGKHHGKFEFHNLQQWTIESTCFSRFANENLACATTSSRKGALRRGHFPSSKWQRRPAAGSGRETEPGRLCHSQPAQPRRERAVPLPPPSGGCIWMRPKPTAREAACCRFQIMYYPTARMTPEEQARQRIDAMLTASGWLVQS